MGYSSRDFSPARKGIEASSEPSGLQYAKTTSSAISRGAPPPSGTRASVPAPAVVERNPFLMRIASSPFEEMERMSALGMPSGRDSTLSVLGEKISAGLPSQAAL